MSTRVLVIPEDPTLNGYLLKPLVCRILEECGKPNATVMVLSNPRAQGFEHAVRLIREQLLERYAHFDLLLFLPDGDGQDRTGVFLSLEAAAMAQGVKLICCAALQEVEVWLLAGHLEKLDRPWSEVRMDVSVKETVFAHFLERFGDARRAGGGRDMLMKETLRNYSGLLQRCPELAELARRIGEAIEAG